MTTTTTEPDPDVWSDGRSRWNEDGAPTPPPRPDDDDQGRARINGSNEVTPAPFGALVPIGRQVTTAPFPVRSLPPWLGSFVDALATATQTPPDLAGVMVLAALATAAGGRGEVEARDGWREPLNMFFAAAMGSGERKSSVVTRTSAPINAAEREAMEQAVPEVQEARTRRQAAEAAATAATALAGKTTDATRDDKIKGAIAAVAEAEAIEVPSLPRILAEDATPEALASLLAAQGGRIAVMSAEGDVFDIMAGRYSSGGPNLGVYLKGHAGDPLRIDRKNRAPEYIEAPALTIGLAIQPDVLVAIADRPGFRGRGLLARFLYALPESTVGNRVVGAPPVPAVIGERYDRKLKLMVETLAERSDPMVLTLTIEAGAKLLQFERHLEPRLGPRGDLGHIGDWAGKLAGATVRLAGLLHLAADVARGPDTQIEATTIEAAEALAHYFASHAVRAFETMAADPLIADARAVARWVSERDKFTRREAHRAHQARFTRAADLDPVLDLLAEHNWIRLDRGPVSTGGRPASPTYVVNPMTHGQN